MIVKNFNHHDAFLNSIESDIYIQNFTLQNVSLNNFLKSITSEIKIENSEFSNNSFVLD